MPEITPEKAALGKALYFDPRLSGHQNMNCASCHNPSFGWEVPLKGAIGAQNTMLGRNAPTILNQAWGDKHYFWDGRAPTLEKQAAGPIEADVEMNLPLTEAVKRLSNIPEYQEMVRHGVPGRGRDRRDHHRARSRPSSAPSSPATRRSTPGSTATRKRSPIPPSAASRCSTPRPIARPATPDGISLGTARGSSAAFIRLDPIDVGAAVGFSRDPHAG